MTLHTAPRANAFAMSGSITAVFFFAALAAIALLSIFEQLGAPTPDIVAGFAGIMLVSFAVLAWAMRSGTAGDHLLASRSVSPVSIGLATATSWIGLAAFTLLTGATYRNGYDALALLIGLTGGLVLSLIAFAPYVNRVGSISLAGLFGERFGGPARLLTCLAVVVCAGCLFVAHLKLGSLIAAHSFGLPIELSLAAAVLILLMVALPGGVKSVTMVQVVLGLLVLGAMLIPLSIASWWTFSNPISQLAYGESLPRLAALEEQMIEKGVIDFNVFRPHLNPFLQIDSLNFCTLVIGLLAGTAAMPHLLARTQVSPSAASARLSCAWSVFFAVIILTAVPAYAALVKFDVYKLIAGQTAIADLPPWVARASHADTVRLWGVSTAMLDDVARATRAGATDSAAISAHLQANGSPFVYSWSQLQAPVQSALADVAKQSGPGQSAAQTWDHFKQSVLPAAATAGGGEGLTITNVEVNADRIVLAFPAISGMPGIATAVILAGVLSAALAGALGLLTTIAGTLSHDIHIALFDRNAPGARRVLGLRCATIAAAVLGAAVAFLYQGSLTDLIVMSFTIAAAVLFPALVLAVWWPRANAWGAVAGMIAGLATAIYYIAGTSEYAIGFAETWSGLTSAGADAMAEFGDLKGAGLAAEGDAQAAALANLQTQASGTLFTPGLANWLGIARGSAAVIAIPVGFLVTILVSLLTPKVSEAHRRVAMAMHDPRHEPVLPFEDADEGTA